jgi:hypothetical protein
VPGRERPQIDRGTQGGFDIDVSLGPRCRRSRLGLGCIAGPSGSTRIRYPHVMNWVDPTEAYAVPRGVALHEQVCAPQGVTGESCVIGG